MKQMKDNKLVFTPERIISEGFKLKKRLDKKTIRTTLTLSNEAIKALEDLKKDYGTFGELIGILCAGVSLQGNLKLKIEETSLMHIIINVAQKLIPESLNLAVRKTIVISDRAQKMLNMVSKDKKISRDVLVDRGIIMMKLLAIEMEKNRKRDHKRALEIIGTFESDAEKIEKKFKEFLDTESPVLHRFGQIIVIISNLHRAIEQEIEKRTPISPDDLSQGG